MNHRTGGPRHFNTVRKSNRKERLDRRRQGRITLLAFCAVLLLLMVVGLIFLICNVANSVANKKPSDKNPDRPADPTAIVYGTVSKEYADVRVGDLIVVNTNHVFTFPALRLENLDSESAAPYDLMKIRQKVEGVDPYRFYDTVNRQNKLLPDAAQALNRMLTDYYKQTGDRTITVYDTYRTYEEQSNKTTPAGYSEHHTAMLVALRYYTGSTYSEIKSQTHEWFYLNCAKYGFIQRYPTAKSSLTGITYDYTEAFRYVGIAHATYIARNNICLEEYVTLLREHHLKTNATDGQPLSIDVNGDGKQDYAVYYVNAIAGDTSLTAVPVPSNYAYTISGDNIGGFIVTVDLNSPVAG